MPNNEIRTLDFKAKIRNVQPLGQILLKFVKLQLAWQGNAVWAIPLEESLGEAAAIQIQGMVGIYIHIDTLKLFHVTVGFHKLVEVLLNDINV